uniref:Uncharacterized protein n=1 Tax=Anguilla anguilla TaxID=7936 RepID=A0A0E9XIT0_ANGAN
MKFVYLILRTKRAVVLFKSFKLLNSCVSCIVGFVITMQIEKRKY